MLALDERLETVGKYVWPRIIGYLIPPVFINAPPMNMTVHDLMNEESKQWDRRKLFATFDRHTFETILTMPLNHQTTQDRLVWMENKAHTFMVRTTY